MNCVVDAYFDQNWRLMREEVLLVKRTSRSFRSAGFNCYFNRLVREREIVQEVEEKFIAGLMKKIEQEGFELDALDNKKVAECIGRAGLRAKTSLALESLTSDRIESSKRYFECKVEMWKRFKQSAAFFVEGYSREYGRMIEDECFDRFDLEEDIAHEIAINGAVEDDRVNECLIFFQRAQLHDFYTGVHYYFIAKVLSIPKLLFLAWRGFLFDFDSSSSNLRSLVVEEELPHLPLVYDEPESQRY